VVKGYNGGEEETVVRYWWRRELYPKGRIQSRYKPTWFCGRTVDYQIEGPIMGLRTTIVLNLRGKRKDDMEL
jgi:hypothetical protein